MSKSISHNEMLEAIYKVPQNYVQEPQWLKPTSVLMALIGMGIGYKLYSHIGAIIALVGMVYGFVKIWKYVMAYDLTEKLKEYGQRYENIYITSQHDTDTNVVWAAEREQELLIVAANKLNVVVHIITFQEGIFVCENWEEYKIRAKAFIDADRATRHEEILRKYPQFYRQVVQSMKQYHSPIVNV